MAKLLANDLAKAEEEYADHLANFRMYFKQLRTREEKFSQLKKNKDSLQGKIDSAEKKLAKMNPEHKDLPTWQQKLSDLQHEMIGMENSVINEEAAIGDYRRQSARSAVAHQVSFSRNGFIIMYLSMQATIVFLTISFHFIPFHTAGCFVSVGRKNDNSWRAWQALDVRDSARQD